MAPSFRSGLLSIKRRLGYPKDKKGKNKRIDTPTPPPASPVGNPSPTQSRLSPFPDFYDDPGPSTRAAARAKANSKKFQFESDSDSDKPPEKGERPKGEPEFTYTRFPGSLRTHRSPLVAAAVEERRSSQRLSPPAVTQASTGKSDHGGQKSASSKPAGETRDTRWENPRPAPSPPARVQRPPTPESPFIISSQGNIWPRPERTISPEQMMGLLKAKGTKYEYHIHTQLCANWRFGDETGLMRGDCLRSDFV